MQLSVPAAVLPTFDKYRLIGHISTGGMAELFLALQGGIEGFSKVVALKRVLPDLSATPGFVEMFLDEARLAARLDHPNIVRIHDFGESYGQHFMAMEYLPGEDLARVLAQAVKSGQRIPVDLVATMFQAAAEGLHFAHELTDALGVPLGVVHRDVNPSNIMVTYQGAVKVLDFGIAKAVSNLHRTQAGEMKGKFSYLAPEQVTGSAVDRRADVFGLGIALWEALGGRRLFARENGFASAQAVLNAPVPTLRSLHVDMSHELEAIAMKALERNPADRFQTAAEFADALDAYFSGRTGRPSARHVAAYMEQLFGERRAQAKRSIAQGRHLSELVSSVMRSLGPLSGILTPSQIAQGPGTPAGNGTPRGMFAEEALRTSPPLPADPPLPRAAVRSAPGALAAGTHRLRRTALFVACAGALIAGGAYLNALLLHF